MRAIDGDRLKHKAQKVATEAWKMKTKATVEVILNEFIDWINEAPTIEPEQSQFIVELEPCCIPFSTMQRVCKHRRTGGIVYGGDAKPRDACHYDMYRSLWDECSMRNCPILNRREIE